MKEINEFVLDYNSIQSALICEIYKRSKVVKVIENVKENNKYRNAVVFSKYTTDEEFKDYGLEGEWYFVTSVATYGRKFTETCFNTKNKVTFVITKDEGNELYRSIINTKTFNYTL